MASFEQHFQRNEQQLIDRLGVSLLWLDVRVVWSAKIQR